MNKDHKVLYSGMQATGNLTLGNYLGALKNWVNLADEYECFYGVMDLHSLTVRQNPAGFFCGTSGRQTVKIRLFVYFLYNLVNIIQI